MTTMEIILVTLVAAICGMGSVLDERQTHRPLVACTLIGLVLGNLETGIIVGGTLELVALGWMNVGAAMAPDAALASVIEVARLSSAQPMAGNGYELDAIAAVVLGGTSLAGGKGRIMGTLIGALILGFLNNALNLLGISSNYQMIVKAVVILLAVLVDNKSSK